MGLFTKYCATCGRKIEKGSGIVRFGKHFDSEEHAEQYTKRMEDRQEEQNNSGGGGCC